MQTIQELLATKPNSHQTQYVDTVEAYDKWAEVYDTDGNFLQRLDTIEMRSLLPQFIDWVSKRFPDTDSETSGPTLVDLGCGTGRNTIQLLSALFTAGKASYYTVIGLDASRGMLDVARTATREYAKSVTQTPDIELGIFDLLQPEVSMAQLPSSLQGVGAAGVISTLVLEHIPLELFFAAAAGIMRSGGYLLVTNMHSEMGMRSQAGFTDRRGVKVRPTSYCHAIPDVLDVAKKAGFEVEEVVSAGADGVVVRGVDEQLGDVLGARAKKWVGVGVWFGVCFVKRG
ncbi:hypothetical protein N7491_004622 [Penicillium cf. griseofulvum]|uniref:Methyltransferase type 11 domain-containing protein n=1 Tax=Penicillium cf. griseofulvum TaxID=2972120 RepID=A0A9W9J1M8_9EURO|nr:hypothetical protein N7472_007312 [Penicillium cf. griseofulvum]KAJ5434027.1 hypothetical protein N7491_004622 [Penicillium cf. griseofulvum]KAJ5451859.1 hypothetical protein N7445_000042 [Penicillium cf. griseofulvum]